MNVFLKVIRKVSSFTNKNRRSQNTGVKSEETDGARHVHRQVYRRRTRLRAETTSRTQTPGRHVAITQFPPELLLSRTLCNLC